jgi:GNAT superfamily N-acetyltransferase
MDIHIRRALPADAPSLTDLMQASSAYKGEYARILHGYNITPAQISRDLIFLAEECGRLLGFYSLMLSEEPELDLMFVAEDAQGTGLGRKLFEHMQRQARERGIAAVKIVSHPPSLGFYLRMGAQVIGVKPPTGTRVTWERPVLSLQISAP